ncbi:MAG: hypothetical protein HYZ90_07335, partial [Candidatus Omnitrophica bacterium]|nr:hypothetical protein [Candidatus Omnitrophota bacterium]
ELFWNLFFRAGEMTVFPKGGRGVIYPKRFMLQESWQEIPYLGGRAATWIARARRVEDLENATGYSIADVAVTDPNFARRRALEHYESIMDQTSHYRHSDLLEELRTILPPIRQNEMEYALYFGELWARQEELRHTQDTSWSFHF